MSSETVRILEVGDPAPSFSLADQQGTQVSLADFKGQRVVVYFYPTEICGSNTMLQLMLCFIV